MLLSCCRNSWSLIIMSFFGGVIAVVPPPPPPQVFNSLFPEGEFQAFENSHDFANPLYFCLGYRKVKTVAGRMPCFESNFKATLCNPGSEADIFVSVMKRIIPARWHHSWSNKCTRKLSPWSSLNSVDHFWHLMLNTSFMLVVWEVAFRWIY